MNRLDISVTGGRQCGSLDDPGLAPPQAQAGLEGRYGFNDHLATLPDGCATEDHMVKEAPAVRASNHQHPHHHTDQWAPK